MQSKLSGLAVTALLMAGAAAPAAAQARGYVGVGAGVSMPLGSFKDNYKLGWLGQFVAGVTTKTGMIGGRVDGMYTRNSGKDLASGTHVGLFGANADLVITPGKQPAKVHPYVLAGIGLFNAKAGSSGGYSGASSTKFAWNAGAGLQVHTSGKMDVFLEARYISRSKETAAAKSTNFVPIAIGLRWGGV